MILKTAFATSQPRASALNKSIFLNLDREATLDSES